jgi:DNA-binding transcriptional LysR family regulator
MNIHHLELFYYVARHGGVSAAARKMPYGIQQPAISAQILRLEQDLGTTLFQRRPFRLTSSGQELYAFIEPFFTGVPALGRRLRGGEEAHLAIGAQELILREYLPRILQAVRKRVPRFSFTLHSLTIEEAERRLLAQQLDVGLVPLSAPVAEGLHHKVIIELPPCLLVQEASSVHSASELWKRSRIDDALVCLPAAASLCGSFQETLAKREVEWPPSLEVPSLDLVARYVAEGYGIGLSVQLPHPPPAGTREVPLTGFPNQSVAAIWSGISTTLARVFIEEAEKFARNVRS